MSRRYFFIGRGERIVVTMLLILAVAGIGLSALGKKNMSIMSMPKPMDTPAEATASTDTIYRSRDYVGPPDAMRRSEQPNFRERVVLDLNSVDSLTLLRVPGIGPAFAHRILTLRKRLGGYYTILQLQEVYGIDSDKYLALRGWFQIKTKPKQYPLSSLRADSIPYHPYLSYRQKRAITRLLYRHERIHRWATLMKEDVFSRDDSVRLSHYFIEIKDMPSGSDASTPASTEITTQDTAKSVVKKMPTRGWKPLSGSLNHINHYTTININMALPRSAHWCALIRS